MSTIKIVINKVHGGFNLSKEAQDYIVKAKNINPGKWSKLHGHYTNFSHFDLERDDPDLVAAVESLGTKANTIFSSLKVVEIPNDVKWKIEEYDGVEWVAEVHRTWD